MPAIAIPIHRALGLGLRPSSLLLGLAVALLLHSVVSASEIDPDRFEKEVLVANCADPMQLAVLGDGRLLFIERAGAVKLYSPVDGRVATLGQVPVEAYCEVGLLGLAAANDFDQSGSIYLFYCPKDQRDALRLSRFTIRDNVLLLESEVKMLEYTIDTMMGCNHQGGGLAWGPDGCLYVGTGDNSYPIPELPVDQRDGKEWSDALRTSANSQSLRGKILRIRPRPDGTYETPSDNLFPDGKRGRPEIYCMGVRNAFRLSIDSQTGWLYWGDVGPNINQEFKIGPEGYDEINQARAPGNFGWPMFTGPNEAYHNFDFETRQTKELFDAKAPVNSSRNNTGIKELPPAVGAFIWYPTGETKDFAGLGSGGRSAMAGPVFRDRPQYDPIRKLPKEYDGTLLAFDWMRNWVKVVRLNKNSGFESIEPFAPGLSFRRPIEMKVGPDGMLYAIEFGDKWNGNTDSQIVRVSYRRGNRTPVAKISATPAAGRHPLKVTFEGSQSFDKDGDPLTYEWQVDREPHPRAKGSKTTLEFTKPGSYQVRLSVRDIHGEVATAEKLLHVGNAPPELQIEAPSDGSFFEWDQPIAYHVTAQDHEEGSTASGRIAPARVIVRTDLHARANSDGDDNPALALMRKSNCFGCHSTSVASGGPAYAAVATKYKDDPQARERLAKKVLSGGTGVWGTHQMPPQSHLTLDQARVAVDWVLMSAAMATSTVVDGTDSILVAPEMPKSPDDLSRRWIITASFVDNGGQGAPPLSVEKSVTLLSRQQRAAFAMQITGGEVVDELEERERLVVQLARGGIIDFGKVDLTGVERVTLRARTLTGGALELRSKSSDGKRFARIDLSGPKAFQEVTVPLAAEGELVESLCLVALDPVTVNWIEFHESEEAKSRRMLRVAAARQRQRALADLHAPKTHVQKWSVADLATHLTKVDGRRSLERGWAIFRQIGCVNCHRLGGLGADTGPDLAEVAQRMSQKPNPRLALLHELVEPSLVVADKFKPVDVFTSDGLRLRGIVVSEDGKAVRLRRLPPEPPDIQEISRKEIDEISQLTTSPMPEGVLDLLSLEEILDLIALLESGGNPQSSAFQK
jgi:cytochrome c